MRIIHIADVHWRGLSRHDEYRSSFNHFFNDIKRKDPDIIYVGGDIVHSKTHGISPELIENLTWWFNEMAKIAPVHVILGNHDGLILNKDRQDAITPIIEAIDNKNIHLYKSSGVYEIENHSSAETFNLCVLSCFDEENWSKVKPVSDSINIGLFHGSVGRAKTDSNWVLEGEISLEELRRFDFALLGDIHRYQYLDEEKRIAYSGSTIQQNYGESQTKGYVLWDIKNKDVYDSEFFPIKNEFPFITLNWKGTVKDTCKPALCYENAKYRIKSKHSLDQKSIKQISKFLKQNYSAQEVVFKVDRNKNYSDFSEPTTKISLCKNNKSNVKEVIREYYKNAEFKEDEFLGMDIIIDKCFDELKNLKKSDLMWDLERIEFDNLFSYGTNNIVDFKNKSGITGIFGKNRIGKSSIVGAIMYTLFNATDRGTIKNEHVVNKRKMVGRGIAYISSEGLRYKIERRTILKQTKKGEIYSKTELFIHQIDEYDEIVANLTGEQRRDTELTLRKIVGQTDDFLMTSVAAQGKMNNFISLSSSARKGIINKFLSVDIFDDLYNIVRDLSQETRILLNKLDARNWEYEIENIGNSIKRKNEYLIELQNKNKKTKERLRHIRSESGDINVEYTHKDLEKINYKISENIRKTNLFEDTLGNLSEKFSKIEDVLEKADEKARSFDLDEINDLKQMRSDVEKQIIRLTSLLRSEEIDLKRMEKSAKILDEVPCGESFLNCKFIKNSYKDKKNLDNQKQKVKDASDLLKIEKKTLRTITKRDIDKELEDYNNIIKNQNFLLREKVKYKSDIDKLMGNIDILQIELKEHNNKKIEINDALASSDQEEILKIIENLNSTIKNQEKRIIDASKEIGMLENKLETIKSEEETFNVLCEKSKLFEALLSAFSKKGIPVFLIKKVLPKINSEIRSSIESLVGFTVEIEYSQKDELEIYINYGDSRRIIELCSGMEKMMASLSIRFVLTSLSTLPRSSMLVIDEGFGALDSGNIDVCNEFLSSMKKWYKNILIISHIDVIKDTVDNIMEINRNGIDSTVTFK